MGLSQVFVLIVYILIGTNSAWALDQSACDMSLKNRLSDADLRNLTQKVCAPTQSTDLDPTQSSSKQSHLLSAEDLLVYEYSDNCYQKINSQLLKTENQDQDILKLADQFDAVLCHYPYYHAAEVFRGANLPQSVIQNYLNSNEINFKAFTSASKSFEVGCEFASGGNTLFKIISQTGRSIEKFSKHENEQEVVFRMNTRFKVLQAISGFNAGVISGCKNVNYYFILEEIH